MLRVVISVMINEKDIEKQNFINWYCIYATADDLEKAKRINRPAMDRLINEYSYEIKRINISRDLHEKLL